MPQLLPSKWAPSIAAVVCAAVLVAAPAAQQQAGANASGQPQRPPKSTDSELPKGAIIPSITDAAATGNRLWIFLFDMSSIQLEDLGKARTRAMNWLTFNMGDEDLVAVMSITSSLKLEQNFTSNLKLLQTAVGKVVPTEEFDPNATGATAEAEDMTLFNNDLRMRGIRTLCNGIASIQKKKALMFFTAVVERSGQDNMAEVHAATEACKAANTSINTIDVHDSLSIAR